MVILVKNAITGSIIGIARSETEAFSIAERKSQPYIFEVKETIYG